MKNRLAINVLITVCLVGLPAHKMCQSNEQGKRQSQSAVKVQVIPLVLPALVGNSASALLKLNVETTGPLDAISVSEISTTLSGTTDSNDIDSVAIYYGGSDTDFQQQNQFGKSLPPGASMRFESDQRLAEGANYFWVACRLKSSANIDNLVGAAIKNVTLSNGEIINTVTKASVQRMGVAVRKSGDDGVHTFRIPGLVTTNKSTLIGVYDIRYRNSKDLPGDIDVGMSRSTDGGTTWEPMQVIMDMGNDPKWKYDGIGDPSIVVDRKTGSVWVAATWSHGNRSWRGSGPGMNPVSTGQFILVKSDDDGVTWSKPINITKQVKDPSWSFLLQGPGKGITLSDGTIIIPAQYQDPPDASNKRANRLPHSTLVYSRDHGANWQTATGAWDDTTESQVVELTDGKIMINCRNNRASKRAVLTTTDLGTTWELHPSHEKSLIEPGSCMASLINVGRELNWRGLETDNNDFLLFSNPDSLRGRNHMTMKASLDAGTSWPVEKQLLLDELGGAGYSCMSMIDRATVGILYEGSQAQLTFQRIRLADILNPLTDQKTKNPALRPTRPIR